MTNTNIIKNEQLLLLFETISLHHCIKHILIRLVVEYHLLIPFGATLFEDFVFCRNVIVLLRE